MHIFGNEYKELLEDGNVLLFARNGIFQARVYAGERRYLYRSLKTKDVKAARKLALIFLHETEFKRQEGMPLQQMTFAEVIDELPRPFVSWCEHFVRRKLRAAKSRIS